MENTKKEKLIAIYNLQYCIKKLCSYELEKEPDKMNTEFVDLCIDTLDFLDTKMNGVNIDTSFEEANLLQ